MSGSRRVRAYAVGILALLSAACSGPPEGVEPVRGFLLERYLGRWYEIARLDHRFERGLTDVTADYVLRYDGSIGVTNRGWDPAEGEWQEAEGRAEFQGNPGVASLSVSFFRPFWAGYHVFALDPDYGWALVCGPSRGYLWILARQPRLDPELLETLQARAKELGFPVEDLIEVRHGVAGRTETGSGQEPGPGSAAEPGAGTDGDAGSQAAVEPGGDSGSGD